jgi:GNAT superfamily N-acetyltransferase
MNQLEVRPVGQTEWVGAAGLAARAFLDEEFMVGMLGADRLPRWVGAHHLYATDPWDPAAVHLGAFAGATLAGVLRASPRGRCFVCFSLDPTTPPEDPIAAGEWEFEVGVREVHLRHPEHAWISRVAVEPQLQGEGVGGALLDAAAEVLARQGGGLVLLECLASRDSFYLRHGFHRLDDIPDPFSENPSLMARELEQGHR